MFFLFMIEGNKNICLFTDEKVDEVEPWELGALLVHGPHHASQGLQRVHDFDLKIG